MLSSEEIKQVYRVDANARDLADSMGWDTYLLFSNSDAIPDSVVRKICHEEFGLEYVKKMGGYAEMNKDNPFRENMSVTSYSIKELYDREQHLRQTGKRAIQNLTAGAVVNYDGVRNEYSFDQLDNARTELDAMFDLYESGESRRESKARIKQAKEDLGRLSTKERSVLIASLLEDET